MLNGTFSTRTIKINESETNVALKAVLAFTAIYTCIVPALKKWFWIQWVPNYNKRVTYEQFAAFIDAIYVELEWLQNNFAIFRYFYNMLFINFGTDFIRFIGVWNMCGISLRKHNSQIGISSRHCCMNRFVLLEKHDKPYSRPCEYWSNYYFLLHLMI